MADLDYAYLADYAAVENGRLTAVGASFTYVLASALPGNRPIAVAGRVRVPENSEGFDLNVEFAGPGGAWRFDVDAHVMVEEVIPYDGKRGALFAVQTNLPLTEPGLYTVKVALDGEVVRVLKFELTLVTS